jgi:drug/metabolite transporter (DMT)-like permease
MDAWTVAAALLSAVLHAGWNAAVKASPEPRAVMTAQMMASAAIVLPGLAWTGLPAAAAWPWILASTTVNLATVLSLLRAYEAVGFAMAYPVARALSVMLVVPLAAHFAGEVPGAWALAGIGLIALALATLALDHVRGAKGAGRGFGWVGLAGLGIAAYVLCDAQGVRAAGSPWSYGYAVSITNALAMGWATARFGAAAGQASMRPLDVLRRHGARALPIAVASVVSFQLILWVWSYSAIAPAAALRDTSAIFAVVIAVVVLKERLSPLKAIAILLAAAAVPLIRLG